MTMNTDYMEADHGTMGVVSRFLRDKTNDRAGSDFLANPRLLLLADAIIHYPGSDGRKCILQVWCDLGSRDSYTPGRNALKFIDSFGSLNDPDRSGVSIDAALSEFAYATACDLRDRVTSVRKEVDNEVARIRDMQPALEPLRAEVARLAELADTYNQNQIVTEDKLREAQRANAVLRELVEQQQDQLAATKPKTTRRAKAVA